MKLLVTGSRKWPRSLVEHIHIELFRYENEYAEIELLHGACPYGEDTDSPYKGADGHADAFGHKFGWTVRPFPPKPSDGRSRLVAKDFAIRNQTMVDEMPDTVVGFLLTDEENKGTKMTLEMARRKGLGTKEIWV